MREMNKIVQQEKIVFSINRHIHRSVLPIGKATEAKVIIKILRSSLEQ